MKFFIIPALLSVVVSHAPISSEETIPSQPGCNAS